MWNNLISRLTTIELSQEEEDEFRWKLDWSGTFSVKSHYLGLINQNTPSLNKDLWKMKIPLKIKIFLWYLRRGVVLTKDNLAKQSWHGNQQCCFYHENKTIQHLFLTVGLQGWYGLLWLRQGVSHNLAMYQICLGIGRLVYLKSINN